MSCFSCEGIPDFFLFAFSVYKVSPKSQKEKGDKKFLKPNVLEPMKEIKERLEGISDFSQKGLEGVFVKFLEDREIKLGKIAQPLRVALTGKTASPGIFEMMEVLGKDAVVSRIEKAIGHIQEKAKATT